ncbi:peroxisomal fatty acid beta-oxidation multifunctional protein AIM1-like [Arachis ipaensis]|uniref:peroxisomal fatty acid beta-oxidation multifunctional protein AIM1-like n=1 Tax=Arachis ipaensis TaxID=130454 RepID=UPI000A2B55E9|nr:peroxisomal fatty acid beta-oxidation multifunctional protein AIM1-like [Arachis ipaensis]
MKKLKQISVPVWEYLDRFDPAPIAQGSSRMNLRPTPSVGSGQSTSTNLGVLTGVSVETMAAATSGTTARLFNTIVLLVCVPPCKFCGLFDGVNLSFARRLQDLAGYGVAVAVSKEFEGSFRGLTYKSPLLDLMIKSGRNGKNNGKGYYIYEKGSKPKPDLSILPIVEESRRLANIMPGGKPISITDQEIVEMILFPIVNEACRVLDEGIVIRASDLDIACVLGMSFPNYRGGVVFWADLVGAKHVYNSLKKWSELYGNFYKPSRYLEERAIQGIPLVRLYICYYLFEFHGT